jgi:hypothetical protein
VGSDNQNHPVNALITGLKPETLYHFRIVATNKTGTTYSPDRTFRTQAGPLSSTPRGSCSGGSTNQSTTQTGSGGNQSNLQQAC